MTPPKLDPETFYNHYLGHPLTDLPTLHSHIQQSQPPAKPIIFLAGDSSLDNKYWVPKTLPDNVAIPEVYKQVLSPVEPRQDVAFWLNYELGSYASTINSAVEGSTIQARVTQLLPHDEFIRDTIRSEDILVVSVGGNDIAGSPSLKTIWHMLKLSYFTPLSSIENGSSKSLQYFVRLFGPQLEKYIAQLVQKTKPRVIIVCMIYYPLEAGHGQKDWAELPLKLMGYNRNPKKLQKAISKLYELATTQIKVKGTKVIPCPLFEVLDPQNQDDYLARVEPSVAGGKKMAVKFGEILAETLKGGK